MASLDELKAARAELEQVNRKHGFRRSDPPGPQGVIGDPKEIGASSEKPTADNSPEGEGGGPNPGTTPEDPGPPRFLGLDIEHKLVGLSGGAIIPVSDYAIAACVDILLGELKLHLTRSLGAVADTHGRSVQLDLFKDSPEAKPE